MLLQSLHFKNCLSDLSKAIVAYQGNNLPESLAQWNQQALRWLAGLLQVNQEHDINRQIGIIIQLDTLLKWMNNVSVTALSAVKLVANWHNITLQVLLAIGESSRTVGCRKPQLITFFLLCQTSFLSIIFGKPIQSCLAP